MNDFIGMWDSLWETQPNNPASFGGTTDYFWKPAAGDNPIIHGFGSTGASLGYSLNADYDVERRILTGTWTSPNFYPGNEVIPLGGAIWHPFADDISLRSGMFQITLTQDGDTFMGAYNYRGQPDNWLAWNGARIGTVTHTSTGTSVNFDDLKVPWGDRGNPLNALYKP